MTRDNAGRIVHRTEAIAGVDSLYDYEYDTVGRLLKVSKDGLLVEEYRYSLNNVRTYEMNAMRGITGRNFSYSAEDHLLSAGSATYQFDVDGFLATKVEDTATTTYHYSSRGELVRVNLPDGRVIEYVYDPLQRRIAKKVNNVVVEKYLWRDMTTLLAIYDGADKLRMRFEYADGRLPTAMTMSGATYYLAYDQVGTLRLVADAMGNAIQKIDYDSFGNIISDSNPSLIIPFGFAGGISDRDTGMVHFGYRDYDPDTGRWIAKDPLFFAGVDANLYGYVQNNPVNFIDPFGLELTAAQQELVRAATQDWSQSQVPYVYGGDSKEGADCSGAVSGIYKQAGIDIGRLSSKGLKNSPLFIPTTGPPQVGDVGVYPGHAVIYGGDTGVQGHDVWSASHTGGPVFGPANSSWYGKPSWYRYK